MNPRTVATRATITAGAGIIGLLSLAGCAADAPSTGDAAQGGSDTSAPAYEDGTYTADGTYSTPESVETITVTVTLESDIITAVEVTGNPSKPESKVYQGKFIGGISEEVVGKDIDEISVSRVAGSSLTSSGFNAAIETIKDDAAG
ncbi:FMN-binding protein [Microbacterium sp. P5_E9]